MSIAGILSSSIFQSLTSLSGQTHSKSFQKEFQQLGQDLQAGNLSQAQSDFSALQPPGQTAGATNTQSSAPSLSGAFSQLAQDLKAGNLTAAQQDYAAVQQDLQQQSEANGAGGHHHHHHHHAGVTQDSNSQNPLDQMFSQLGQALQSGNLSQAQSAYTTLQQDFLQMGSPAPSSSANSSASQSSNALSVTV